MPLLTVRRDAGWTDKFRKYRIILDGVEIGQLAEGATLQHEISEGQHVIEARVDWCGSPLLRLDARSSDHSVVVSSALRGWRVLLASFYILNRRNDYLEIEMEC